MRRPSDWQADDCSPAERFAIQAIMLWPCADQHVERSRFIDSLLVCTFAEFRGMQFLADNDAAEMFGFALDAAPSNELAIDCRGPFMRGMIAGTILTEVVRHSSDGQSTASMGKIVQAICAALSKGKKSVRPGTINNEVWPHYRRVAHYWAAYMESERNEFPFAFAGCLDFLRRADALRVAGENTRTSHSPNPVLRTGESIDLAERSAAGEAVSVGIRFLSSAD